MTELGIDTATIESIPESQLRLAVSAIRTFLRQAEDLIDAPDRPPGWTYDDPALLQNQGQASMLVAGLIARVAPALRDLDARLRADGARFLDVETGVGLLAVAMCQAFPTIRVIGIDPWAPALELGRRTDMFRAYERAAKRDEVSLGQMHGWDTGAMTGLGSSSISRPRATGARAPDSRTSMQGSLTSCEWSRRSRSVRSRCRRWAAAAVGSTGWTFGR